MKNYNINNEEIAVATCLSCGHQVDVSNIKGKKLILNGIDEMEMGPLVLVDSIMKDALHPCCDNPDYGYLE